MASQNSKGNKKNRTSAKGWKKADEGEDLELPSGNIALVRRPGLERLIAADFIPDSLLPMAENAVQQGKGGKPAEVKPAQTAEMVKDKKMVADVFLTMDRVAEMVVVEPKVVHHRRQAEDDSWVELTDEEKEAYEDKNGDDFLWSDVVDFQDKAFIFQFVCGGTRNLERFREQTGLAMVDVPVGEDLEDAS